VLNRSVKTSQLIASKINTWNTTYYNRRQSIMSNYPPPPYGALAPQVGSYNSGMAQQSYQQQNLSPYYYGPSQPNGVSPAPHANAHSFQVNAQDVRASLPSNGVNHGPTFAKYEQAPYNTLPPPPYPPVSIPYGAPSYAPHCSSQPLQSLHTASAHPFPPSHLLHSQQSTNDNPAVAKPLSPPQPELEDGEVDDTEPDKTVNRQEAASMGSIFSRSPGGEQNESEGSIIAATHSNQVTQPSRLTQGIFSPPLSCEAVHTNSFSSQTHVVNQRGISPSPHPNLSDRQCETESSTFHTIHHRLS